jgi:hypothetical protein
VVDPLRNEPLKSHQETRSGAGLGGDAGDSHGWNRSGYASLVTGEHHDRDHDESDDNPTVARLLLIPRASTRKGPRFQEPWMPVV